MTSFVKAVKCEACETIDNKAPYTTASPKEPDGSCGNCGASAFYMAVVPPDAA